MPETATVGSDVRFIQMPEELVQRARNVLYFKEAIRTVMREMMKEVAKNHGEAVKLWTDVKNEAVRQGYQIGADEAFSFDYITDRFMIIKAKNTEQS